MTLGSGIVAALTAAILFGASTPLARALTGAVDPAWLAGCLYAGSGLGLSVVFALRRVTGNAQRISPLTRRDLPWLVAAIASGGIVAPLLFTFGLRETTGATASLLLNLETVLTVLLAWFVFREHYGPRVVVGMALIVAACALIGGLGPEVSGAGSGALLIALACLGTARASAYYATAPFIGVAVAFAVLAERPGVAFWIALPLMALGVWLHLTERHTHLHAHEALVHDHPHRHDVHHRQTHDFPWDGT